MRQIHLLLVCAAMVSTGLAAPTAVPIDRDRPFEVYAEYARKLVSTSMRGADVMRDVAGEAAPKISRLLAAGQDARARALASDTIGKIERVSDFTKKCLRRILNAGVDALLKFSGHVRPQLLRDLIEDLEDLAARAAGYVESVEDQTVSRIKSLFN